MAVDAASLITLSDLKAQLGITSTTDDTVLERCIDRASKAVESYCQRVFKENRYYETHDTTGQARLVLKQNPVTVVRFVGYEWDNALTVSSTVASDAMVSVSVDDDHLHLFRVSSTGAETSTQVAFGSHDTTAELAAHINTQTGFSATSLLNLPARYLRRASGLNLRSSTAYLGAWSGGFNDYQIDLEAGIVFGPQLRMYRGMFIDYSAGYATVPYDVQEATTMIAARIFNGRKRDTGLASESLGGYSYSTRASSEVDAEARELLATYRRIR